MTGTLQGTLKDGTPFLGEWVQRCSVCGSWVGETTISHGRLGKLRCEGKPIGGRTLSVTVAKRLTDLRGKPRWREWEYVCANKTQLTEVHGLFLAQQATEVEPLPGA